MCAMMCGGGTHVGIVLKMGCGRVADLVHVCNEVGTGLGTGS